MKSEEQELRNFIEFAESQPDIKLSDKELHHYFAKLVAVAKTQVGYRDLCWEAGIWLLLLSDNKQDKTFVNYAYEVIGNALSNTIVNGTLPDGLGWYVSKNFIPSDVDADGDVMLSILSHEFVEAKLTQCLSTVEFKIAFDRLDASDPITGNTLVIFLSHLHRFGLDLSMQLMWAARLVQHLSPENPAQRLAVDLVLICLMKTQRYTNAFYWLEAYYADKVYSDKEEVIYETVSALINNTLGLGIRGYKILARLSYDEKLIQITSSFQSDRSQLLLGFITLWLLAEKGLPVKQDLIEQSAALLWGEYANISKFMVLLSRWSFEITTLSDAGNTYLGVTAYLNAPNDRADAILELEQLLSSQPKFNRGGRTPFQLWEEVREREFDPLISAFKSSNRDKIEKARLRVAALEPDALIDDTPYQYKRRDNKKLEKIVHDMIAGELKTYIDKFLIIADLSQKFLVVSKFSGELDEIRWVELRQECEDIVAELPYLKDYIDNYFRPLVDVCTRSG